MLISKVRAMIKSPKIEKIRDEGGLDILYEKTAGVGRFGMHLTVAQRAPQKRSILFEWWDYDELIDDRVRREKRFFLPFPYVIYGAKMWYGEDRETNEKSVASSRLWVWFSNEPLKNFEQQVFRVPLTNVNSSGQVCQSAEVDNIHDLVAAFWQSKFSTENRRDSHPNLKFLHELGGMKNWARIDDPLTQEWSYEKTNIKRDIGSDW